jgi:hypothetical protein
VNILKRMLRATKKIVIVAPKDTNNNLSEGYQIHVKGGIISQYQRLRNFG